MAHGSGARFDDQPDPVSGGASTGRNRTSLRAARECDGRGRWRSYCEQRPNEDISTGGPVARHILPAKLSHRNGDPRTCRIACRYHYIGIAEWNVLRYPEIDAKPVDMLGPTDLQGDVRRQPRNVHLDR